MILDRELALIGALQRIATALEESNKQTMITQEALIAILKERWLATLKQRQSV